MRPKTNWSFCFYTFYCMTTRVLQRSPAAAILRFKEPKIDYTANQSPDKTDTVLATYIRSWTRAGVEAFFAPRGASWQTNNTWFLSATSYSTYPQRPFQSPKSRCVPHVYGLFILFRVSTLFNTYWAVFCNSCFVEFSSLLCLFPLFLVVFVTGR